MSKEIVISLGNATFAQKLDALGALIAAVREGHRDVMSVRSWAALGRAQDNIAEAMLHANDGRGVLLDYHEILKIGP